jgi:CDGSH-type Zn-finger protein/truncated hemoglobin YjbI
VLDLALSATAELASNDVKSAARTFNSIVRPLGEAIGRGAMVHHPSLGGESPWELIDSAISDALCVAPPDALLLEAAAGLRRLYGLKSRAHPAQGPELIASSNGPYLLVGKAALEDHLGRAVDVDEPVALCRCGRSQSKPFCDGAHVDAEFSELKDLHRVADHRDTYVGQAAVVYDNRGLCAHSGFCTDRLNSVFHLGEKPFVTASGARLDEIVRAVRKCPSGALSFGMDGREVRDHVDQPRPATIQISRNGPYRVVGSISLIDEAGSAIARPDGASLEHYSLCRCGSSLNKPFCSGMHWNVEFADPVIDPDAEPTLFEWAGGYPALLDMTTIFYSKYVPQDELIGPLFADMSPDHPERVAAWLSEVFGGPRFYSDRYGGYGRMVSQHTGKNIKPEQRQRWATLMVQSADDAGLPSDPEFRAAFLAYIEWGSGIAVENSGPGAVPPPNMPVPKWWWVCNATPGARPSALPAQEAVEATSEMPEVDEDLQFDPHIKSLFRAMDRNSMKFAFDLWAEADVAKHGEAILARLRSGTMPCDGAWPAEKISLFEKWLRRTPADQTIDS